MKYNLLFRKKVIELISSIDGWLSPREAIFLYLVAQENEVAGEVVEIGSWKGKSTVALGLGLMAGGKAYIHAIDPHLGQIESGRKKEGSTLEILKTNLRCARVESKIKLLVTTSQKAAEKWHEPIRLLFIDGLHDWKNARRDFELWAPYVSEYGMIIFHDAYCGWEGVGKVVSEVLNSENVCEVGVQGSMVYLRLGPASWRQRLQVFATRGLINFANWFYKLPFEKEFKFRLVRDAIRFLLVNRYDIVLHKV